MLEGNHSLKRMNKMNTNQLNEMFSNLSNWKTISQITESNNQFTKSQLKHLFWKRDEYDGLSQCIAKVGNKLYVNEPAFALWLSGQIGEKP